jgi:hypothetical protein
MWPGDRSRWSWPGAGFGAFAALLFAALLFVALLFVGRHGSVLT